MAGILSRSSKKPILGGGNRGPVPPEEVAAAAVTGMDCTTFISSYNDTVWD